MSKLTANSNDKVVLGPVRRIGVQSRSVTGTMPDGARYESSLERDFMLLMEFDHSVDIFTPQPISLQYTDRHGSLRRYTPDGLVQWRADLSVGDQRPVLVEVKYRAAFSHAWKEWLPKFRAARRFANSRGWAFAIYTEREIRTTFLANVVFLLPYRRHPSTAELDIWILDSLKLLGQTTPGSLIRYLYRDRWNQATILPAVWKLLADRNIGCDLTKSLSMSSPIWHLE